MNQLVVFLSLLLQVLIGLKSLNRLIISQVLLDFWGFLWNEWLIILDIINKLHIRIIFHLELRLRQSIPVLDFLDELLSNLSYLGLCVYLNTDGRRDLAKLSIGLLNLRLDLVEQPRDLLLEPELINLRYNVIYCQDAFSKYVRFRFLQLQLFLSLLLSLSLGVDKPHNR